MFILPKSVQHRSQEACALISLDSGCPPANSLMLLIVVSQIVETASRVKKA